MAIRHVGLPFHSTGSDTWAAYAEPRHGYLVKLELLARGGMVACVVTSTIVFDREWITRKLAMRLLEANNNYVFGSNRLLEGPDGVDILHGHMCDVRVCDVRQVAEIAATLVEQMQALLTQLYAEELIVSLPDDPPRATGGRRRR